MAESHEHSVSVIETATACSERWRLDLIAVRSLFRQHRTQAQQAKVQTGWEVGISLAMFLAVLGVIAVTSNGVRAPRRIQIIMTTILIAGLLALIEDVNILSATWGGLATTLFVIVVTAEATSSWQQHLWDAATAPLRGPYQLATDLSSAFGRLKRNLPAWLRIESLMAWLIPLVAFAIFLALFTSANPLIEYRLMQIDLGAVLQLLAPLRVAFWLLIGCAIWPLLRWRAGKPWQTELHNSVISVPSEEDYLFGVQAVLRSLILLNMLFALQTGLDLTYLWGGAALPGGLSHAEYAHRGAYPLIVTALLAAGFVLVAMRPGGPAEKSRLIRPLVLLWTGQNILLVISSIFRLDLYVAAYSLTYLRLAAFIWMVLVSAGLLLMLIQIFLKKPNSWLVTANAAALALILYGCCFINAPWLVASYNVEHCREVGGTGPSLDMKYLESLGSAQTLPPLEAHVAQFPGILPLSRAHRVSPDRHYLNDPGNWRAWGFRRWRIERYFANTHPERNWSRGSMRSCGGPETRLRQRCPRPRS